MLIDTDKMVSITEANKNFSRVAKLVDENGSVVIMKNNMPRYIVRSLDSGNSVIDSATLDEITDKMLEKYSDTFRELAK